MFDYLNSDHKINRYPQFKDIYSLTFTYLKDISTEKQQNKKHLNIYIYL